MRNLLLPVALGALLCSGAASAERDQWGEFTQAQVRDIQDQFGRCVVARKAQIASRYVLDAYDAEEGARIINKLADGDCLVAAIGRRGGVVRMKFPGGMLKYAIADALVRTELTAGPISGLSQVAPLAHPTFDPSAFLPPAGKTLKPAKLQELEQAKSREQGSIYMSHYGECVVRRDPANSHALLMADPDSAQENAAFGRLRQAFGHCLDAGRQLELNKVSLRGTVALNYYRLAKAPRVTAAGPGTVQ
jgi:hypothetical protein